MDDKISKVAHLLIKKITIMSIIKYYQFFNEYTLKKILKYLLTFNIYK